MKPIIGPCMTQKFGACTGNKSDLCQNCFFTIGFEELKDGEIEILFDEVVDVYPKTKSKNQKKKKIKKSNLGKPENYGIPQLESKTPKKSLLMCVANKNL